MNDKEMVSMNHWRDHSHNHSTMTWKYFCITDPRTSSFSSQRASNTELWYFLYCWLNQSIERIAVTSQWARLHLKLPASRLFTQSVIQAQIKENTKVPRHCEFPAQMASNADNFSIWWRHHWHTDMALWRIPAKNSSVLRIMRTVIQEKQKHNDVHIISIKLHIFHWSVYKIWLTESA